MGIKDIKEFEVITDLANDMGIKDIKEFEVITANLQMIWG